MRRRRLLGLLPALAAPCAARAQARPRMLRIGLIPYQTPATVLRVFQPLRDHLQDTLQMHVQLFTAADFRALAEGARDGAYDLATLPAHLARIAVLDWGHQVLGRTAGAPTPLLLLARKGAVTGGEQRGGLRAALAGAAIATIDPLSLTALELERWLLEQRLQPGRDVVVIHARSIASVLIALDRGDVHFAAVARAHLQQASLEQRAGYDTVATYALAARLIWTAHRALDNAFAAALRSALLSYRNPIESARDGPAGGVEPATLADTDAAEPLAADARRLLRAPR